MPWPLHHGVEVKWGSWVIRISRGPHFFYGYVLDGRGYVVSYKATGVTFRQIFHRLREEVRVMDLKPQ